MTRSQSDPGKEYPEYPLLKDNDLYLRYFPDQPRSFYIDPEYFGFTPEITIGTSEAVLAEAYKLAMDIQAALANIPSDAIGPTPKSFYDKLKEQHGEKKAMVIILTYIEIFPENNPLSRPYKEAFRRKLVGEESNIITDAFVLNKKLIFDILNTLPITETKTAFSVQELTKQFNDYMRNRVPDWITSEFGKKMVTKSGKTSLSSLEFKNYLARQPEFEALLKLRELPKLDAALKKEIDDVLNRIYDAKNSNWLDDVQKKLTTRASAGVKTKQELAGIVQNGLPEKEISQFDPLYQFSFYLNKIYEKSAQYAQAHEKKEGKRQNEKRKDMQQSEKSQLDNSITFFLDPPKELVDVYKNSNNLDPERRKLLEKKYANCAFLNLENHKIYLLGKKLDYKNNEVATREAVASLPHRDQILSLQQILKDHHEKGPGIRLSSKDFDSLKSNLYDNVPIEKFDQELLSRISDAKQKSWLIDNERSEALHSLYLALANIPWQNYDSERTMRNKLTPEGRSKTNRFPTPAKNIMNELEASYRKPPLHPLKDISRYALFESQNKKNNSEEKIFYNEIAKIINFEATFNYIKDQIIEKFVNIPGASHAYASSPDKGDFINGKRVPRGVKLLYDKCNGPHPYPEKDLLDILNLAKYKKDEVFTWFRHKDTQKFYEDVRNMIILHQGASLKSAINDLVKFEHPKPKQLEVVKKT